MSKLITTSWDDGFVLDLKIAELLHKYNLQGTFYIPKKNCERAVMSETQIISISKEFEIGGHTLNHVRLNIKDKLVLRNEIAGSFNWLTQLLGNEPICFCFPGGKFSLEAVKAVSDCGYKLARTTELLNIEILPVKFLLPTTLQVYNNAHKVYAFNLLKRAKWRNLLQWLVSNSSSSISKITETYLNIIDKSEGCFHLWGHSWEIEEYNLWAKLENLFKILSSAKNFSYIKNKQLLTYV